MGDESSLPRIHNPGEPNPNQTLTANSHPGNVVINPPSFDPS